MKRKGLIILLITVAITGLALNYGHTFLISLRLRAGLASSKAVYLELFDGGALIQRRELNKTEKRYVADAFPIAFQLPVSFVTKLCFIPHHRIVLLDAKGQRTEFDICFHCDQYAFPGTGIRDMPAEWPARTRQLFERFGLPSNVDDAEIYLVRFISKSGAELAIGNVAFVKPLPAAGKVRALYHLRVNPPPPDDEAASRINQLFRDKHDGEVECTIPAVSASTSALILDFMPGLADANVSARVPQFKDGKAGGEWSFAIFSGGDTGGRFEIERQ